MNPLIVASHIIKLSSVDSTNNYAAKLIQETKVVEGTAILASFQQVGRGQRGAKWQSSPGMNLLTSIILYPTVILPIEQFVISKAAALAVCDVLIGLGIAGVQIKWPNDILVDQKKICGMLIENSIRGAQIEHSIIGIGLNVNEEDLLANATSIRKELNSEQEIEDIANRLYQCLDDWYSVLRAGDVELINRYYNDRLFGKSNFQCYEVRGERDLYKVSRILNNGALYLRNSLKEVGPFGVREVKWIQD